MSESKVVAAAKRSFTCRNIKKDFTKFTPTESVTKDYHLELGENYEIVVVEDRPVDWAELANKDADKVGLANIIAAIERQGLDIRTACAFKDEEAMDLSEMDPMNPHAYADAVRAQQESYARLVATAERMGVTVESLIAAAVNGDESLLVKVFSEPAKEGD